MDVPLSPVSTRPGLVIMGASLPRKEMGLANGIICKWTRRQAEMPSLDQSCGALVPRFQQTHGQ